MTNVTVLRHHDRTCSNCEHAYFGPQGVFCMEFRENVPESAASDCPSFDPLPESNGASPRAVGRMGMSGNTVVDHRPPEDKETLVDTCDRYLANLHCVLWGEPFEIITPRGRKEAAEWLAEQVRGLGAPELGA